MHSTYNVQYVTLKIVRFTGLPLRMNEMNRMQSDHICFDLQPSGTYTKHRAVFSLNFSSAGKEPFMAAKAKNMCQRRTFLRPILRKSAVIF